MKDLERSGNNDFDFDRSIKQEKISKQWNTHTRTQPEANFTSMMKLKVSECSHISNI